MEEPHNNERDLYELTAILQQSGIDTSLWGVGRAKTLRHLQKEIEEGEIVLTHNTEGKLVRKLIVGEADICCILPDGKKYRLKEERQVFTGGRERRRNLPYAVSGKVKVNENLEDALVREVKEELGIEGEVLLVKKGNREETRDSESYPGLKSEYNIHTFELTLTPEQFRKEGYKEVQQDKTTYFVWEEMIADSIEKAEPEPVVKIITADDLLGQIYKGESLPQDPRFLPVDRGGVFKYFYPTDVSHSLSVQKPEIVFVALEIEGEIVALSELQTDPWKKDNFWLKFVSVDPKYQNKGYATKVIDALFQYTKGKQCSLEVSSYSDDGAQKIQKVIEQKAGEYGVTLVKKQH